MEQIEVSVSLPEAAYSSTLKVPDMELIPTMMQHLKLQEFN